MLGKKKYEHVPDEELMKLVQQKDAKAFEALYDRYSKLLFTYFCRMLWRDRERARDFTQELFSKIIHKPELFDPSRSFKTWLYSVAHNMCKNEYAKHEVRKVAHQELKRSDGSTDGNDSARQMDRAGFHAKLDEALSELDETKRTTFELRFRQEMSIQEISEAMQCSEGTVKSRLFYTLKELQTKLKHYEGILMCLCFVIQ
jgi:RNA polymerase sigma-70 factor (ECF subfamily)